MRLPLMQTWMFQECVRATEFCFVGTEDDPIPENWKEDFRGCFNLHFSSNPKSTENISVYPKALKRKR